jgi:hypothetical protein
MNRPFALITLVPALAACGSGAGSRNAVATPDIPTFPVEYVGAPPHEHNLTLSCRDMRRRGEVEFHATDNTGHATAYAMDGTVVMVKGNFDIRLVCPHPPHQTLAR